VGHPLLWIPVTIGAALAQVLRNGAQAGLTRKIGTLGATQVRFVFGLPFAALFLAVALALTGAAAPALNPAAVAWCALGALSQIAATALMLMVMRDRAFSVAYAYIKTEPILVALLGAILIGDSLGVLGWIAVAVVTVGVLLAAVRPGHWHDLLDETGMIGAGLAAGGLFGLSAIAFRGAIGALPEGSGGADFVIRSLEMLVLSLAIQSAVLGVWLALRDRAAFTGSLREWRGSLGAGLAGAAASAGWFTAFALTPAANVRTLALIEMPIAALLAGKLTGKVPQRQELIGMGVVMAGLALLFASVA